MQTRIISALLAAVLASGAGVVAAQPHQAQPSRARLGIAALSISPELRTHFGAPSDRGLLVDAVQPDSPAARAGVHVGDVVTDVDGDAASSASDIVAALSDRKHGDQVAVDVVRDHKRIELNAKLETDPQPAGAWDQLPDDLDSWFRFDGTPDDMRGAFEQMRQHMRELEQRFKQAAPSTPRGERT
jgi:predicted metalloprotease with PDZ domain